MASSVGFFSSLNWLPGVVVWLMSDMLMNIGIKGRDWFLHWNSLFTVMLSPLLPTFVSFVYTPYLSNATETFLIKHFQVLICRPRIMDKQKFQGLILYGLWFMAIKHKTCDFIWWICSLLTKISSLLFYHVIPLCIGTKILLEFNSNYLNNLFHFCKSIEDWLPHSR